MSNSEARLITELQEQASEVLVRHRSILDIMTKLDEYNGRINRAIAKSVTFCGCMEIAAKKQDFNSTSLNEMLNKMDSHIVGCERKNPSVSRARSSGRIPIPRS